MEERAVNSSYRERSDVNRIYPSKEAYTNALYDSLLGYIDGKRFHVMEKSAIALKMTDGQGSLSRTICFPKMTGISSAKSASS